MTEQKQKEALLNLRSELAYKVKGNHSWSFGDKELTELLKIKPKTLDELGKIKGFPRDGKRVKAYGNLIVDIFNNKDYSKFDVEVKGDSIKVTGVMKRISVFGK